ncbi:hypothetical protein QQS21_009850 [Conoideocrella luteorostrata]|uniref:FAD-binding PCMH-type domain-containing protein n=1 Tax=Conoideocrella luteorostrata TaxID=1105319 RepID=A0AAJ0CGB0_9HYPO|nr:hypothetical protein QQS21_009850 [Conoideocrella luteorostrata]
MTSPNILTLLSQAGIPHITPHDADFSSTLRSYTGSYDDAKPAVVTLPTSGEQVAAIVTKCIEADYPMVVRGGGHDVQGRFAVKNAVSIDLRNLNSVIVAQDTARVGGGVTSSQVLEQLEKHGRQAATGSCGSVGFTGWSLIGGLGAYVQSYGLGADQIVGATVVNGQGQLVDADSELLKGLRGGGGSLAVVVELTVKVYPLQKIQAGLAMYDSSDIEQGITTFFTNFDALTSNHKIPSQLSLMPFTAPFPGMGVTVACAFVWNGPASEESAMWVDRVAALAPVAVGPPGPKEAIRETTPFQWITMLTTFIPPEVTGRMQTASITKFSPDLVSALAKSSARMPKGGFTSLNFHLLRSDSPSCSNDVPESVLPYREPHIFVEIMGFAGEGCSAADAAAWSLDTRNAIMQVDGSSNKTYLALTALEFVDLHAIYGEKLEVLKELKRKYDPNGVFRNTLPRLLD